MACTVTALEGGRLQVTFLPASGGEPIVIGPVRSQEQADLVCDVLTGPIDLVLDELSIVLQNRPRAAGPLYGAFVASRVPLSEELWSRIPLPLPEAAQALPAALACSAQQARQVVWRMSEAERQRLQLFGLCLARLQRRLRMPLPGPLPGRIMALITSSSMATIDCSNPAPRVTFQQLGQFVGKRVTLVGRIEGVDGNTLQLRTPDNGVVAVQLQSIAPQTSLLEVQGLVNSPTSLTEDSLTQLSDNFDLANYSELCKLAHSPQFRHMFLP
ncbi:replication A 14 kDa subunit B [Chlorella sorokiniana]|uniref:Replication A 14 kDa subunit B n=1 Tax=Chlorella sorokiniana TaxID=3076 RepID=A0A2P6TQ22_CHLSO|nr:replication A 14 kDa subunit B [Chlorella sorokiniana]|eukprot:PRW56128.1 replication A 14 kDa subunit B [Chlorella sorokiniana]